MHLTQPATILLHYIFQSASVVVIMRMSEIHEWERDVDRQFSDLY